MARSCPRPSSGRVSRADLKAKGIIKEDEFEDKEAVFGI